MNLHLSTNMMLREIFELGTPLLDYDESLGSKPTKSQRVGINISSSWSFVDGIIHLKKI